MPEPATALPTLPSAPIWRHWPAQHAGRAPRAALLIVHGLAEHSGCYADFAAVAAARGIAVYAPDLPGHGLNVTAPELRGHLGDHDGWTAALACIAAARDAIRAEHPHTPLFLFGHSMGSFLCRWHVAARQPQPYAGLILSATVDSLGPQRALGALIARVQSLLRGPRAPCKLLDRASFTRYNRHFAGRYAQPLPRWIWLTRDAAVGERLYQDPLRATQVSTGTWRALLLGGAALAGPRLLRHLPAELPIHLIVGTDDALTGGAAGPARLLARLRAADVRDASLKVYTDGRHELLHDLCAAEVTGDLLDWILTRCPPAATARPV